ncbi:hypothetical protein [Orenia metallireducens]|nr:hypothetical protein [Orenia metallireducens]
MTLKRLLLVVSILVILLVATFGKELAVKLIADLFELKDYKKIVIPF